MEQFIDVVKAEHEGRLGYLLIGQERMVFADLSPRVVIDESEPSTGKTVAVTALFGVVAGAAYTASKSSKIVDTEDKKRLREIFDKYIETRDKSLLSSVSLDQLTKADPLLKLDERNIPYSSTTKVGTKKPNTIAVTKRTNTGLAAEIYGSSKTLEFKVSTGIEAFRNAVNEIKHLLPERFSA